MSVPFGRDTSRCEPEQPGGEDERAIRIRKRLAECLKPDARHQRSTNAPDGEPQKMTGRP
jgi:hypothetical protein